MNINNEPKDNQLRNGAGELNFEHLLAQLRQDQLDAALAGHIAEAAFYAAEAQALREEFAEGDVLCA